MKKHDMLVRMLAFARLPRETETSDWTNARDFLRLCALSRRLSRIGTDNCNGIMTENAYENKIMRVHISINKILIPLGMHWYHQTDPRGVALYVSATKITDMNYTNGLAIF